jgi:hypothetical protein
LSEISVLFHWIYCDIIAGGHNSGAKEKVVAGQRHGKHLYTVMNTHTTTEELLEMVLSM